MTTQEALHELETARNKMRTVIADVPEHWEYLASAKWVGATLDFYKAMMPIIEEAISFTKNYEQQKLQIDEYQIETELQIAHAVNSWEGF